MEDSVDINTFSASLQMECTKLQSDIQHNNLTVSFYHNFRNPIWPERNASKFTIMSYSCNCF